MTGGLCGRCLAEVAYHGLFEGDVGRAGQCRRHDGANLGDQMPECYGAGSGRRRRVGGSQAVKNRGRGRNSDESGVLQHLRRPPRIGNALQEDGP